MKYRLSYQYKNSNVKEINYYFFDDIINIKSIDPNKIKMNKNLQKSIFIYHIGYVTIKSLSYANINNVNPVNLVINKKYLP